MSSDESPSRYQELPDIPTPDPNAPCPLVFAFEGMLLVSYLIDEGAYSGPCKVLSLHPSDEQIAVVRFIEAKVHSFVPVPVDCRYQSVAYEILDSDWRSDIRELYTEPLRHISFGFRDADFDCLCERYLVDVFDSTPRAALEFIVNKAW